MSNKTYVGGATAKTGNFGEWFKISFNKTDLEEMFANLNEKGYININMQKRREPSQYGQTHSLVIDDWKPDPNYQRGAQQQTSHQEYQQQAQQEFPSAGGVVDEDCPFSPLVDIRF